MLIKKDTVLSWEEKATQHWFTCLQIVKVLKIV